MSDKVNITKLLALREAMLVNPKDLAASYVCTKAVMDAADVLLEVAGTVATWGVADDGDFVATENKLAKLSVKVTL